tara:strand:+ start:465 stop:593 length:129 start_codon:yes stop_codon:yes gene_type:complete
MDNLFEIIKLTGFLFSIVLFGYGLKKILLTVENDSLGKAKDK